MKLDEYKSHMNPLTKNPEGSKSAEGVFRDYFLSALIIPYVKVLDKTPHFSVELVP